MTSIRRLECAIVKGDTKRAPVIAASCLQEGLSPAFIIEAGILRGLETVGRKWKSYEIFIPNVLVSAMATKLCLDTLHPALPASRRQPLARVVAGTVEGDVHDIGKNIVLMFMEAAGFHIVDLGIDVPPEDFVKAVRQENADLLLLSCLYTVTMHAVEDTIVTLRKAGLKGKVKTLVGGAPVTADFASGIGADGYGADAVDGVRKAKELVNGLYS